MKKMTYRFLTICSNGERMEGLLADALRKNGQEVYSYSDVVETMINADNIPEDSRFYRSVIDEVRPDVICVSELLVEYLFHSRRLSGFVEQLGTQIPVVFRGFDDAYEKEIFDIIDHPNKHFITDDKGIRKWADDLLRYLDDNSLVPRPAIN